MFVEGEFLDTIVGIPDSRTEVVMLQPPDGGTRLEPSSFVRPEHQPGSPAAMADEMGLRNVPFEVDDLQAAGAEALHSGLRAARQDGGASPTCAQPSNTDQQISFRSP